ncbi:nickel/cobalt transporter [Actinoplanes rectilineatus]|uniref:nickel/cobalt transporter n=1 Tax=Actinoplanes rectilineatus TaxID=113571 RepID=UPI0006989DF8|nr:cobalt transporter [Actinoplanes rectilineatus]
MNVTELSDRLQDIIHTPGIAPAAFVIAFLAGAWHAVTPGHGKTLAAAYLAGSRGRIRDAAWLGGSVAVMHTFSVLVIGVAWTFFSLSDFVRMEQLTGWLQVIAGVIILGTGVWMLRRHLHGHSHSHGHSHGHGHDHGRSHDHGTGHEQVHADDQEHDKGHQHDHGHGQDHGHDHDHVRKPGLLLLGISGGLTPSPAAFLVLATGLFLGRAGFALLLVLTFGIGMAVVLFGVGVLAVAGSSLVTKSVRTQSTLRLASRVTPLIAAGGITLFGAGLVTVAAAQLVTAG